MGGALKAYLNFIRVEFERHKKNQFPFLERNCIGTANNVIVRKKIKNNLVIFFIGKSEQAFYTCKYIFKI
ncbi:hypothetical protein DWV37_15390 [Tannerella sp. AF04-6]|nr:hypothetical protein DWV37_15390 [Tannerella sp. AF04-6]